MLKNLYLDISLNLTGLFYKTRIGFSGIIPGRVITPYWEQFRRARQGTASRG